MAHQITLTLAEQEYAALQAMAVACRQPPEMLLHDMIVQQLQNELSPTNRSMTAQEFMEQQYREGKTLNIPMRRRLTQEEEAEIERLGRLFVDEKPLSDIVIEDRGPY